MKRNRCSVQHYQFKGARRKKLHAKNGFTAKEIMAATVELTSSIRVRRSGCLGRGGRGSPRAGQKSIFWRCESGEAGRIAVPGELRVLPRVGRAGRRPGA